MAKVRSVLGAPLLDPCGARRIEVVARDSIVRSVACAQLLAMKLCAWREDLDSEDARFLLTRLDGGREVLWEHLRKHLVPGRELEARRALDDSLETDHGPP